MKVRICCECKDSSLSDLGKIEIVVYTIIIIDHLSSRV